MPDCGLLGQLEALNGDYPEGRNETTIMQCILKSC